MFKTLLLGLLGIILATGSFILLSFIVGRLWYFSLPIQRRGYYNRQKLTILGVKIVGITIMTLAVGYMIGTIIQDLGLWN